MGYFKDLNVRINEAKEKVRESLFNNGLTAQRMDLVGSAYIIDRNDSDIDILAYVPHVSQSGGVCGLDFVGWDYGGTHYDENPSEWGSWKKHVDGIGEINMLLTTDEDFFNFTVAAAEVCRYLHLMGITITKDVRVGIHRILRGDSTADYENERKL